MARKDPVRKGLGNFERANFVPIAMAWKSQTKCEKILLKYMRNFIFSYTERKLEQKVRQTKA